VPLFHPRQHSWDEHFAWNVEGIEIIGLTPTGRATVVALNMNDPLIVECPRAVGRLRCPSSIALHQS
jgi:hypothetical protein